VATIASASIRSLPTIAPVSGVAARCVDRRCVGESLPFRDRSFDVGALRQRRRSCGVAVPNRSGVGSDSHAGRAALFHSQYSSSAVSRRRGVHSSWRAIGLPYEDRPFADHTTHLTLKSASELFRDLPVQMLSEKSNIDEARARARKQPPRHLGDRLKRVFFKNALYEVVARRQ
jgi:hypothetical protein